MFTSTKVDELSYETFYGLKNIDPSAATDGRDEISDKNESIIFFKMMTGFALFPRAAASSISDVI